MPWRQAKRYTCRIPRRWGLGMVRKALGMAGAKMWICRRWDRWEDTSPGYSQLSSVIREVITAQTFRSCSFGGSCMPLNIVLPSACLLLCFLSASGRLWEICSGAFADELDVSWEESIAPAFCSRSLCMYGSSFSFSIVASHEAQFFSFGLIGHVGGVWIQVSSAE